MIASAIAIDPRRAAEFTHPDNERILQQPALLEILHQRTHGAIHDRELPILERGKDVLVVVPAAKIDFHKRDSLFDKSPGHQTAPAKSRFAVSPAVGGTPEIHLHCRPIRLHMP